MSEHVGEQIGNYRLLKLIGRGSFGDVYLSDDMRTHQAIAIKFLGQLTDPQNIRTFINEARNIRLRHPYIVSLLDFGIHETNTPFLVMDYAPNGSLAQLHPKGTQVPLSRAVS